MGSVCVRYMGQCESRLGLLLPCDLSLHLWCMDQGATSLCGHAQCSNRCWSKGALFPWSEVADGEGYPEGLEGKERDNLWNQHCARDNKRCCCVGSQNRGQTSSKVKSNTFQSFPASPF